MFHTYTPEKQDLVPALSFFEDSAKCRISEQKRGKALLCVITDRNTSVISAMASAFWKLFNMWTALGSNFEKRQVKDAEVCC